MDTAELPERVVGTNLGLPFPSSPEALVRAGADFLTEGLRATGALGPDNAVTAVRRAEEFVGGGAGRKMCLSVRYARDEPGLHHELFAKLPRDAGDPLRELFSHLMEPETRFALLTRRPGFPVAVPRCYFADYDPGTRTGLLITERIRYGEDGIEPFRDKCLDHRLPDPLAHYEALVDALAELAAGHRRGALGPGVDEAFPFDAEGGRADDLIPYSPAELQAKIDALEGFAREYPRLLPGELTEPAFVARFRVEAPRFLEREPELKRALHADPDMVALCHWNANIDNAWFRRDEGGTLRAGLLDFGSVGRMNVAQAVYGLLCAVEPGFWDAHAAGLVERFGRRYQERGGPRLDPARLRRHVGLYVALLGLAWMLDAPALVRAQLPDLDPDADRHHPDLLGDFLARAQLHLMTVFLHVWRTEDLGAALDRVH